MRIVEDVAQVEGGHAIVIVEGKGQYLGDGTLGIRRLGYEAAHLAAEGWRVADARVTADRYEIRDGAIQFYLGPEVTRHLTSDDHVAIDVNGIPGQAVLAWPMITPFYEGKTEFRRFSARPRPAPVEPPAPASAPAPDEEPTVIMVPLHARAPQPQLPPESETVRPTPMPPPPPLGPDPDEVARRKGSQPEKPAGGRVLAVVLPVVWCLAALGIGAAAWHFRPQGEAVATAPAETPPALPDNPPSIDLPPVTDLPPETLPETPPQTPPVAETPPQNPTLPDPQPPAARSVQDIVRSATSPQQIYDEALKFRARGDYQGMLLLLENAAERGHGEAMLEIGRLYDPATFIAGQPFSRANPAQAAKFYRKAEAAGVPEAATALAALKTLLDQKAAGGDAEARAALAAYWP
ncbi:hypothetical protein DKG75_15690 [Zavarzinia compransoris]|uniref:Sel1 repeat family protein n=2 Tax=Zavarzinia compransoris TaxID=1264899 RepID=A0A317E0C7_9PROT|nr:hypothetical protein DKG75_15690 [Zavarzinia compransoris]